MVARLLILNALVVCLGLFVLLLLVRARELKTYWPMLAMAMWQAPPYFVLMYVRHLGATKISPEHAYTMYFYTFWFAFAAASMCSMLLTYTIFRAAMRPLKGLQTLGNIMFLWAAGISLATAVSLAASPLGDQLGQVILVVSQLQRSTAVLIISLVLFVALSIRPMGLSWRSRVFGASLGTMVVSGTNMIQANFQLQAHSLYTTYGLIRLISSCVALCIWAYYFAFPEPKRKFILLPTTSPFHFWNSVSERLGHDPGMVAIGGVAPDVLAGAELEIFRRASIKMKELEEQQTPTAVHSAEVHSAEIEQEAHDLSAKR